MNVLKVITWEAKKTQLKIIKESLPGPTSFSMAGQELKKANKNFVSGLIVTMAGVGLGGIIIASNPNDVSVGAGIMRLGGITGFILQISAWGHIKKAEEAL